MSDARDVMIDGELHERLTSWCRAHDVSVEAIVEVLLDDLPEVVLHRQPRTRRSRAVEPVEELVIPHAELVQRLVADREANALGDAGGIPLADPAREKSLVGPSTGTREVCHVHGWVGRHRFEADNHAHCDPAGDACTVCNGIGYRTTGSLGCGHCKGTGVEPARVVFDETPIERTPSKVQASPERNVSQINGVRIRRRRTRPRAKTIAIKRLTKSVLRAFDAELGDDADLVADRPRTRAECPTQRPCPFVGCKHHLYLDVDPETGSIKLNFPDLEPEEIEHSCALDAADRGAHTLEAVAEKMNITRERCRQVELKAYFILGPMLEAAGIDGTYEVEREGNHPDARAGP
jgi:hypothetical protein